MEEKKEMPQEFKSDAIAFTLERKEDCIIEYHVTVIPDSVKTARTHAVRAVAKEVSLPGFRKGRAPDALILKKYPKPVEEQWQKAIADLAFKECQKLSKTPILNPDTRISFDMKKHSLEEGAEMTFSFETEPLIPDIKFEEVEIEEVKREVVDKKKIDGTIEQIQMFFAEWEKISDRTAQEGDYVIVDVDLIETDPPQRALNDARFELKDETMAKWMKDLVLGMKIGEAKEGISEVDKNAPQKEKEDMPPKKVRLTLKSIEIAKPQKIDDALAQKVGVKTAAEMKENIEKLLNKQADEHKQQHYRAQVNDFMLNKYPFDLPKSLLKQETEFRIKQLIADPAFQKKLTQMNEDEKKQAIKEIEIQGERAVRLFYIARKIVQEQKIQISPNEIHKEVSTPLEAMFSQQTDVYNAKEQSQEQKAIAMSRLLLTKAEDYLISKATIVPAKPKKKEVKEKTETPKKKTATKKKTENAK